MRSRKDFKPSDSGLKLPYRSEIWQAGSLGAPKTMENFISVNYISRIGDFTRFGAKMFYRLVDRGHRITSDEKQQGKSEGFESCDRPIVRKRPIWVKVGDVLSRVTLKFYGWPWKRIGHLFFAVSSFVQHFIAIGEFKLELQSGNDQFESNSMIFRAMWPWNLTEDLAKQ